MSGLKFGIGCAPLAPRGPFTFSEGSLVDSARFASLCKGYDACYAIFVEFIEIDGFWWWW